jgi:hypothetical protein
MIHYYLSEKNPSTLPNPFVLSASPRAPRETHKEKSSPGFHTEFEKSFGL